MSCAPLGSRDLGWSPSVHAGMGGRPHTPALPPGQRGGSVQRRESPSCPARLGASAQHPGGWGLHPGGAAPGATVTPLRPASDSRRTASL